MYLFDSCSLDPARVELRRDGQLVHVEPQVFDVLAYLVEHRERVVTKEELLDNIWGDRFVSESALTTRIKAARRATLSAVGCGVVTSNTSARGRNWLIEIATSPVPGGRSSTR